jgi:hypothetical protein
MRGFVLFLTLLFGMSALAIRVFFADSGRSSQSLVAVAPVGLIRLTLVMGALWLAWPTVRKPAMWFPPGILAVALIGLGVCVLQPRLALALVPAIGGLIAFTAVLRFFRGK